MALLQQPSGATNLGALQPYTTAVGAIAGSVLAVPQFLNSFRNGPQYTVGYQPGLPPPASGVNPNQNTQQLPPAFQFHYEGEQKVQLQSDITDHYVEDNTTIQNQIALKPEIIYTHGFIGELNNVPPKALAVAQSALNVLGPVSAYSPQASLTAQLAYNEAFQLYQTANNAINAGVSAISSIAGSGGEAIINSGKLTNGGLTTQSKQQQAFQLFYGWWQQRILFTVQTPWAVFLNCAILSVTPVQDGETTTITDFAVSFKVIRTAQTTTSTTPVAVGRAQEHTPVVDLGVGNTTSAGSFPSGASGLSSRLAGGSPS